MLLQVSKIYKRPSPKHFKLWTRPKNETLDNEIFFPRISENVSGQLYIKLFQNLGVLSTIELPKKTKIESAVQKLEMAKNRNPGDTPGIFELPILNDNIRSTM